MQRYMLFTGQQVTTGGVELLQKWRDTPEGWIWLDLRDEPQELEQALLQNEFKIDELDVEEAQRPRHPPTYRASEQYLFVLLKPLVASSHNLDFATLQLALFVGQHFLVTRHTAESPHLERLWQHAVESSPEETTPLTILEGMSQRIVDRYGAVLLDLETRVDEIEETLFKGNSEAMLQELVTYNTQLRGMRRIINYHLNVFDGLRHDPTLKADKEAKAEMTDIHAVMDRFNTLADLYQNVISDLIDGYISLNGHRLNQIMKVLTIVTVMFVPLSLLVGIYGMNFENIPELKIQDGYYILLTVMGLIAGGLLMLFRRLRWL